MPTTTPFRTSRSRPIALILLTQPILLLLFHLPHHTAAAADPVPPSCYPGSIPTGSDCTPCPAGTYHTPNADTCTPCPPNTFSKFSSSVSAALCLPCPSTHASKPASSVCTPCPSGRVPTSSGTCIRCRKGAQITDTGCRNCTFGISTEVNSRTCTLCPEGTTENARHTKCVPKKCPPGTSYRFGTCAPCFMNNFNDASSVICMDCPLRQVAAPDAASCVDCPSGTYVTAMFDEARRRSCAPCPDGTTTHGVNKPFCISSGESCPSYAVRDADGDCNRCVRDEYFDKSSRTCRQCPAGTYSRGGIATACLKCKIGQDVLHPREILRLRDSLHVSRCACPDGHVVRHGKCTPCPAGTRKAEGELRCEACGEDEFSGVAASECTSCPAGTTGFYSGSVHCDPMPMCPEGHVIRKASEGCVSGTTGCPPRSRYVVRDSDQKGVCSAWVDGSRVCESGTFADMHGECITCGEGWKLVPGKNGTGASCKQCLPGWFSVGANSLKCRKCPDGFIGTGDRCLCDPGKFINEHNKCVPCPDGLFSIWWLDCHLSTFLYPPVKSCHRSQGAPCR